MVQKEFIDVLKLLVKIESISSEKKHYKDVEQSAESVKDLFEGLGLTSKISKSNEGMPAVLAQTEQDPSKKNSSFICSSRRTARRRSFIMGDRSICSRNY